MQQAKPHLPTFDGILQAFDRISEILPATPLLRLNIGTAQLFAKAECLCPVGAFKIRGGWNRLSLMTQAERARGVVSVSSGNHAQGVAWAARRLGIAATIIMPRDAPKVKLDGVHALGAKTILYDRLSEDRDAIARTLCQQQGATFVHAYGDAGVIEGQGSAGIEVARQMAAWGLEPPSRFVVPCGGGGLCAGLALACPDAEIIPVEPEGWDDVARSLACGEIQSVGPSPTPTACDALQTLQTWPINFEILKMRASPGICVSEAEIRNAQRFAFSTLKLVLEPGGAAALAAAIAGKVALDGRTVLLLTGGNVDPARFANVITSPD